MDEAPEDPDRTAGDAAAVPPTPLSARDAFPPPAARQKPTPARAMSDAEPVASVASIEATEELTFRVGDRIIVARTLGRSGRSGSTPLLLIGFWPGAENGQDGVEEDATGTAEGGETEKNPPLRKADTAGATAPGDPEHAREALVVAKDLADLGEDALRLAWLDGREPPARPGAPPRRNDQRRRR